MIYATRAAGVSRKTFVGLRNFRCRRQHWCAHFRRRRKTAWGLFFASGCFVLWVCFLTKKGTNLDLWLFRVLGLVFQENRPKAHFEVIFEVVVAAVVAIVSAMAATLAVAIYNI